jgi:hypothetical protein
MGLINAVGMTDVIASHFNGWTKEPDVGCQNAVGMTDID